MRVSVLFAALLLLAAAGCRSGSDKGTAAGTSREPKDPRTVPSATLPPQIPSPILAVDAGQPQGRPTTAPNVYVVKAGDTPAGIAKELGVELSELLRVNNIDDPRSLKVGQQLKVPRPGQPSATPTRAGAASPTRTATPAAGATAVRTATAAATPASTATPGAGGSYTVQAGDTGCGIAAKLGVPLTALAQANNTTVQGLGSLRIGQELKVPTTRGPAGC